ncbi:MAG: DUF4214 domain-containing protein [Beijerinckiaceae bacterium]|nr:DUF4214 domain-containing protein [Beijerinckiaceae bacterium]
MSEVKSQSASTRSASSNILTGIGGQGAKDILAASAEAGNTPLFIAYNFPGLLGTTTYAADPLKGQMIGNGEGQYFTKWAPAIVGNPKQDISASALAQSIKDYAQNTLKTNGLFSSLIPNTKDGFIASTNNVYQRENYITKQGDVALPPEYRSYIQPAITAYQGLFNSTANSPLNLDLRNNHQNNTLLLGPYSNANIVVGDGNNIIINSPAMFDASLSVFQRGYFDTTAQKSSFWFFYPAAQGAAKSNTLNLGEGNNLVYFDSSMKLIATKDGDNVFVPSFGSFNWAKNNFQQSTRSDTYYQPTADNKTWFTPFTLSGTSGGTAENKNYGAFDTYSIVGNYGDGNETHRNPSSYSQMTYVGGAAGAPNNPLRAEGDPDPTKLPSIGGQKIKAGNGNDVFYGVDPYFYHYNEMSVDGSTISTGIKGEANRDVFIIPTTNTKNERFSFQNFETITMLGGRGNDIFYLGNPTRIAPDGLQYQGDYSYKISTNREFLADQTSRANKDFFQKNPGVDIIEINLSSDLRKLTNTTQSYDPVSGQNQLGADFAKAAVTGYFGAADKLLDTFTNIGESFKFMPLIDIGLSAATGISEMIKIFTPAVPPPVVVSNDVLTQPLGQWRQSVEVSDWNPGTIINIKIDPTFSTQQLPGRWSNIIVGLEQINTSSDGKGTAIFWQKGGDPAKNKMFVLDGLGVEAAGYYSFNFKTGKYDQITDRNLDFFGTITPGVQGISPLKNYKANNGFVFSSENPAIASMAPQGAYQFYWSDKNNPSLQVNGRDLLNEARESSQILSVQFDSRSLGWYWQPSYISSLPPGKSNPTEEELRNAISIDENTSKLWIVDAIDSTKWEYHTFADFKTKTEAFQDALQAKTYYQIPNRKGNLVDPDQKLTQNLVDDFELLIDIMPNLKSLQQSVAAKVKLTNLGQISAVEQAGKGVDIFFVPDQATADIYKMTVTSLNGKITASDPVQQKNADVWSFEIAHMRDIDGDNVVGASAVEAIKTKTNPVNIIESFYVSILERASDPEGLAAWVQALEKSGDELAIVRAFLVSPEKQEIIPDSYFIDNLYALLLNRHADKSEAKGWIDAIEDGVSRAQIVDGFLNSSEFMAIIGTPHLNESAIH